MWLENGGEAVIRINGADTPWYEDDIALLAHPGVREVMLPKAEDPASIIAFVSKLRSSLPVIRLDRDGARDLGH